MSNGNAMVIRLIVGLMKKTLYKVIQYFHKLYHPFGGDINVKVDLFNYATTKNLKKATGIYTFNLALKSNLAKLKAEADKVDVAKLKTVLVELIKLSDVVKQENCLC